MSFFKYLTLTSLLVAISSAAPFSGFPGDSKFAPPNSPCMTAEQANQVANFWPQLIGNYSDRLAIDTLTVDFADYSESALSLNSVCPMAPGPAPPLTAAVFSNRTQFQEGQGSQPPIESEVLNVWNGCTSVTMRYNMTNLGSRPVIGVIAIATVKAPAGNPYPYQIQTTYSEFDSGAWVQNLQDAGKCPS